MKSFIVLLFTSLVTFGQSVVSEEEMFSPERKRFTETCIAFANDLAQSNSQTDYNAYFSNTLSNEYIGELKNFQSQLLSYSERTFTISADLSNENVYVLVFQLGENSENVTKLFLLFNPDDNLVDDFMVISNEVEVNTEEEVIPYTKTEVEIPTTTVTIRIADIN
ncbi:hypothetical protein NBRC110019_16560 [Neptunitalea chrysea]|uniref:Uncharacterized protein n=1 Tax=Neptunitalea chrysea TaxID=1647581 RepID=A0A9W6B4Y1_9FLAO|nr:hypothetical protein [Neptunitalea chrysea]GLB52616.1 hypothetical protein NBRC110019_16560 [Neptunitalea chrysea]